MIKKVLTISFWVVFTVGVFLLMSFVYARQNALHTSADSLSIEIEQGDNAFITEDLILNSVEIKLGYRLDSVDLDEVNLEELENHVSGLSEVEEAQVFKSIDGALHMRIKERTPIVRIVHQNGMSNYLDANGNYMALSRLYTAHVPIVTGHINESEERLGVGPWYSKQALGEEKMSDEVFELATYLREHNFWQSQIQQIYINEHREFELIPRVGDHRIFLGGLDDLDRKLKKLKIFYEEGLNNTGWNQYDTINITYRNQIVCS